MNNIGHSVLPRSFASMSRMTDDEAGENEINKNFKGGELVPNWNCGGSLNIFISQICNFLLISQKRVLFFGIHTAYVAIYA